MYRESEAAERLGFPGGGVQVGETKTEKGTRSIQLPPSTVEILKQRKKKSYSEWIFHDPVRPELPLSPATAYRRMKTLLRYAELPSIRFHNLRHIFATMALERGMDVKDTLHHHRSCLRSYHAGHLPHVTDTMQKQAAVRIDHQIGKTDAPMPPDEPKQHTDQSGFQPYKSKYRNPAPAVSTNSTTTSGRASTLPEMLGKRISRNVYAKTREECEEKTGDDD